MLNKFKAKNHLIFGFVILIAISSSCIPAKRVKYLQSGKTEKAKSSYINKQIEYKVQPGDNLYIKLSSLEPEINLILTPSTQTYTSQGASAKYKDIYYINTEGFIKLPQINKVYVKGYTLDQVKDTLELKIDSYLKQISVDVRLADNFVTILGEVNKPGRYLIDFKEKISVFELVGMAGDLKYEANRSRIKLLRKNGENIDVSYINMLDSEVLENEYYYLSPNDIVYIEPLNAVFWDKKTMPFSTTLALILSVTTSILVIISYIK
ncbi:MAG: polysaccharide biosynthesis/export family protein [Bacteroidota bacterium]